MKKTFLLVMVILLLTGIVSKGFADEKRVTFISVAFAKEFNANDKNDPEYMVMIVEDHTKNLFLIEKNPSDKLRALLISIAPRTEIVIEFNPSARGGNKIKEVTIGPTYRR